MPVRLWAATRAWLVSVDCLAAADMTRSKHVRAGRRLADHLALLLAKRAGEEAAVMLLNEVAEPGLAAKLVDALGDLVAGGVAEAREEREELLADGGIGMLAEDDLLDVGPRNLDEEPDNGQPLVFQAAPADKGRRRVRGGEGRTASLFVMSRLAIVSTGWKTMSSAIPEQGRSEVSVTGNELQPLSPPP